MPKKLDDYETKRRKVVFFIIAKTDDDHMVPALRLAPWGHLPWWRWIISFWGWIPLRKRTVWRSSLPSETAIGSRRNHFPPSQHAIPSWIRQQKAYNYTYEHAFKRWSRNPESSDHINAVTLVNNWEIETGPHWISNNQAAKAIYVFHRWVVVFDKKYHVGLSHSKATCASLTVAANLI